MIFFWLWQFFKNNFLGLWFAHTLVAIAMVPWKCKVWVFIFCCSDCLKYFLFVSDHLCLSFFQLIWKRVSLLNIVFADHFICNNKVLLAVWEWKHEEGSLRIVAWEWLYQEGGIRWVTSVQLSSDGGIRMAASGLWSEDGGIRNATSGRWHQVFWLSKMWNFFLLPCMSFFLQHIWKRVSSLYFCCSPFYMQQLSFGGDVRMAIWGWQYGDGRLRTAE